ncbi:alpha/beta hydrolase-fold protein [Algoriphagus halophilus]|uniref:Putative esterase n=1 Tax=Algoriphagus halophilus TaxID=226505 RepID=A0A1N6G3Z3_9BACT|nr:alpha/beta hydrolase-fold protein [Algoriphagus halophilus]SIO02142.1 Putative esterase [Algoriphagus halophilus]
MNRKIIVFALSMLFVGKAFAQENVTIKVIVPNKTDEVFITGNQESLGNWDPGVVKMDKVSDFEREITTAITYPAEFKFTKGKWENEGIINQLDNNPNQKLSDANSKNIFVVKGWANETIAESLGLGYSTKIFQSNYLGAERLVKIALPENYDPAKKYPVFYTTDAGWNMFTVAKNYISNLSLDEYRLMPESILVGIVHGTTNDRSNRNDDLDVYYKETGQKFKNFIFEELVPYINRTYSTSGFNVMIGHSNGAEYNHFLLLEEENPFRGFISLSTNFFAKDVRQEIGDLMKNYQGNNLYYFVANATTDSPDRIEAGNDYEEIYQENMNPNFQFKKQTYEANHNSVVPLALVDGIQFIFKDYRNVENYKNLASYRDHYLKDMKANYGIEEEYSIRDLESLLMDIIMGKKKEGLEEYLKFVEDNKLWQLPKMREPGGYDGVNKGNFYFFVEDYKKSAESYRQALDQMHTHTESVAYFGNFDKTVLAFKKIEDYEGLMNLLLDTKFYLNSDNELTPKSVESNLLYINYQIAKLASEHDINRKEGKKALAYCKDNYRENRIFTVEELEGLL